MRKLIGLVKNVGFKTEVQLGPDVILQRELVVRDLRETDNPEHFLIVVDDDDVDGWQEGDLFVSDLEFQVCQNENVFKQQIRAVCPQRVSINETDD